MSPVAKITLAVLAIVAAAVVLSALRRGPRREELVRTALAAGANEALSKEGCVVQEWSGHLVRYACNRVGRVADLRTVVAGSAPLEGPELAAYVTRETAKALRWPDWGLEPLPRDELASEKVGFLPVLVKTDFVQTLIDRQPLVRGQRVTFVGWKVLPDLLEFAFRRADGDRRTLVAGVPPLRWEDLAQDVWDRALDLQRELPILPFRLHTVDDPLVAETAHPGAAARLLDAEIEDQFAEVLEGPVALAAPDPDHLLAARIDVPRALKALRARAAELHAAAKVPLSTAVYRYVDDEWSVVEGDLAE